MQHYEMMQYAIEIEVATKWFSVKSNKEYIIKLFWNKLQPSVGLIVANGLMKDKQVIAQLDL